jgi:ATP-dependent Clp protease ATP-binding subunit ClpA
MGLHKTRGAGLRPALFVVLFPAAMTGYNFTDQVRKTLQSARKESARLDHDYVGTEHLLLGLVLQVRSVAMAVLLNLEVDWDELKAAVEKRVPRGQPNSHGSEVPYTSRAKKVLEMAMMEARELGHDYVGTEHILLGLIREGKGVAAQVLESFGVVQENARHETLRLLGKGARDSTRDSGVVQQSVSGRGYNFTDRVRKVLQLAREEAAKHRHDFVGPEHILLGLLREGSGVAIASLRRLGVEPNAFRDKFEQSLPPGKHPNVVPELPYSARAKKTLELAMTEARELDHEYIGTEHLLVGILREQTNVGAQALVASGANIQSVRTALLELKSGSGDSC